MWHVQKLMLLQHFAASSKLCLHSLCLYERGVQKAGGEGCSVMCAKLANIKFTES